MRCHPIRWLWGLIPVAMLAWLAVHLKSAPMERDLEQRSGAALSAAGHDWASVGFCRSRRLVGRARRQRGPARRGGGSRAQCMGRACRRNARRAFAARYPTVDAGACPKASGEASLPRCLGGAGGHGTRNPQGRGANRGRGRARGQFAALPTIRRQSTVHARDEAERTALPVATLPVPQAADTQPPAPARARRLLRRPPRCLSTSQRRRNRFLQRLPPTSRRSPPASRRSQKRLQGALPQRAQRRRCPRSSPSPSPRPCRRPPRRRR